MIGFDPVEPALKERAYSKQARNLQSDTPNFAFSVLQISSKEKSQTNKHHRTLKRRSQLLGEEDLGGKSTPLQRSSQNSTKHERKPSTKAVTSFERQVSQPKINKKQVNLKKHKVAFVSNTPFMTLNNELAEQDMDLAITVQPRLQGGDFDSIKLKSDGYVPTT